MTTRRLNTLHGKRVSRRALLKTSALAAGALGTVFLCKEEASAQRGPATPENKKPSGLAKMEGATLVFDQSKGVESVSVVADEALAPFQLSEGASAKIADHLNAYGSSEVHALDKESVVQTADGEVLWGILTNAISEDIGAEIQLNNVNDDEPAEVGEHSTTIKGQKATTHMTAVSLPNLRSISTVDGADATRGNSIDLPEEIEEGLLFVGEPSPLGDGTAPEMFFVNREVLEVGFGIQEKERKDELSSLFKMAGNGSLIADYDVEGNNTKAQSVNERLKKQNVRIDRKKSGPSSKAPDKPTDPGKPSGPDKPHSPGKPGGPGKPDDPHGTAGAGKSEPTTVRLKAPDKLYVINMGSNRAATDQRRGKRVCAKK